MSPGKLHGEARAVPASSSEDYLTTLGLLLDFGGEPRSGKKQIPMCSLQSLTCLQVQVLPRQWVVGPNTRHEFADLMDRGLIDVAQPDVGRVGGLTEARRVVAMARERGRLIVPHCWKTGIGIAASAHLAAITPHCPYIEFLPANLCDSLLRKELVADELKIVNGQIPLPRKPGLGIEINRQALRKFEVSG